MWPAWSPDGRSLVVQRRPEAITGPYPPSGASRRQWDLVSIPAEGGATAHVSRIGRMLFAGASSGGEIFLNDRLANRNVRVVSQPVPGGARRNELEIKSFVRRALPSPDRRWLAVEWRHDVYVTPLPSSASAAGGPIDLARLGRSLRRLSTEGGYFARWRGSTTLEFSSGNRYYAHDVRTGRTDTVTVRLTVAKPAPTGTIALRGARIVTMDRRRVIEAGTVVVTGTRLRCVGDCDAAGADRVIDVTGKTIIPGLIDHHAHHLDREPDGVIDRQRASSGAYLAHGVTTILDPATSNTASFTVAEMVEAGRIVGPHSFTTGTLLICMDEGEYDDAQRDIRTLADAREHVNRQANFGAVAAKDYKLCTRTARQLIAQAARERGIGVVAEAGDLVYNLGLIMGGHTGWEHPLQTVPVYRDVTTFLGQAGAHHTPNHLIADFPHGTSLEYWLGREDLWNDPKAQLWFPWQESVARRVFVQKPLSEYYFPILAEASADIKRAGGYVAVGDHGERTGRSTSWELGHLAMAMTPMEALEAATLDGAHYIGIEGEVGSLEVGKLADLVVLSGNPLETIRHTAAIAYVMKAGRLYDGMTLDEVWPAPRPYGARPWVDRAMFRSDTKSDTGSVR